MHGLCRISNYRWEFADQGRDFEMAVRGRLMVNDGDMMLRAARDGLGLSYLLESFVRDELVEGRLERVLDAFCPPFPGFFLYYPSRKHIAPKLRAFVDFLTKRPKRTKPRAIRSRT